MKDAGSGVMRSLHCVAESVIICVCLYDMLGTQATVLLLVKELSSCTMLSAMARLIRI